MFVSVDGLAKQVTEIYAGGTDGKAHKVNKLFGSVDGVAKQLFTVAPKTVNGFDIFTWAEIKQLANENRLLEFFNLYDKVTIQLKTPLTNTMRLYMSGYGVYKDVPQMQKEMQFKIVELTENKMRLMCPRVSVLGTASSDLSDDGDNHWWGDYSILTSGDTSDNDKITATQLFDKAWGLTPIYTKLKTIQNALPDDLLDVLSICATPMTKYVHHHITDKIMTEFDYDMKVRQVTTNVLQRTYDDSNYDVVYPVIIESYYPTTIGDYMYHIQLPMEYDTYAVRRYLASWSFRGLHFLDYTFWNTVQGGRYTYQSYTDTPFASCGFSKGMTTNDEFEEYLDSGRLLNTYMAQTSINCNVVFPEIIIEKD